MYGHEGSVATTGSAGTGLLVASSFMGSTLQVISMVIGLLLLVAATTLAYRRSRMKRRNRHLQNDQVDTPRDGQEN